jgi:hypothetical protein
MEVVNLNARPLYTTAGTPEPIEQASGWAPEPAQTFSEDKKV